MRLEPICNRPLNEDEALYKKAWQTAQDHRLWEQSMTFPEYQAYIASEQAIRTPNSHYYWDRSQNGLGNTVEGIENQTHVELTLHNRYSYPVLHNHSYVELIYVASGQVRNILENTVLNMKEGDVCILSPSSYHALSCTNDESCILNIMIGKEFFDWSFFRILSGSVIADYLEQILYARQTSPYILFPTGTDAWMHDLAQHMVTEMVQKRRSYEDSIRFLTGSFLIHLSREYEPLAIVPGARNDAPNNAIVSVLTYLNVHYRDVTLEELARFFGYSPAYLSRMIHENVGKPFSKLLVEIRMKNAAQLLIDTQMSVSEIAQETGCYDASHLTKKFHAQYGMSPCEYRQHGRETARPQ